MEQGSKAAGDAVKAQTAKRIKSSLKRPNSKQSDS